MAEEPQEERKYCRKLPCVNHPTVAAVARCEICGNAICKTCIGQYGGAFICSSECWTQRMLKESQSIFSKAGRRLRMKSALSTLAGFAAVVCLCAGALVYIIYPSLTRTSGEKVWDIACSPSVRRYSISGPANAILFFKDDDTVEVVDLVSGEMKWATRIPEGHDEYEAAAIDIHRALLYHENKLVFVRSDRTRPVWQFALSQPHLTAGPIFGNETFFLASSSRKKGSNVEPLLNKRGTTGGNLEEEKTQITDICAVEAASGAELWRRSFDDVVSDALVIHADTLYALALLPEPSPALVDADDGELPKQERRGDSSLISLFALNAATGIEQWKIDLQGNYVFAPAPAAEGLIVVTGDFVYLVSLTGAILWEYPLEEQVVLALRMFEDLLFICTGDGLLACIDISSGRRKWMVDVGVEARCISAASPNVYICGRKLHAGSVAPEKNTSSQPAALRAAAGAVATPSDVENSLLGVDMQTGEKTAGKTVKGRFRLLEGLLYCLSVVEPEQAQDSAGESRGESESFSVLCAYSCLKGEKLWEAYVDGAASNVVLTDAMAVVEIPPEPERADGSNQSGAGRLLGFAMR
jgi:outer membrane protein assembly factor BamB